MFAVLSQVLILSMPNAGGKTTTHALGLLEPRGILFTTIQQEVYNGMIIGECSRDGEMEVSLLLLQSDVCWLSHVWHVLLGVLTLTHT